MKNNQVYRFLVMERFGTASHKLRNNWPCVDKMSFRTGDAKARFFMEFLEHMGMIWDCSEFDGGGCFLRWRK